jgi:hypothetical protein
LLSALRGIAPSGHELLEPSCERLPPSSPAPAAACLEHQTLGLGLVLTLEPTLKGQLSKCLVVQHGLFSSLISNA